MSENEVAFSLVLNVEGALNQLNKVHTVLSKSLNLFSRMTGDENIQRGIANLQHLIGVINQARIAAMALRNALFLGAGPLGLALAGISVGITAMNVLEYAQTDNTYDQTWGA
jgi:hypothetical protein